jgi:hypothetical protein
MKMVKRVRPSSSLNAEPMARNPDPLLLYVLYRKRHREFCFSSHWKISLSVEVAPHR